MAEPPIDGSDALQLILSACKLVDLLLVLQTEEFQMYVPSWLLLLDSESFVQPSVDFCDRHRRRNLST